MKNKKSLIILAIIILLIAAGISWILYKDYLRKAEVITAKTDIENLAKCLTAKGVVMYGAYWCPHCQAQKKMFGDGFKYINYVECTKDIKKCQANKIDGYPTWIFKNGERLKGETSFSDLASKSTCKISGASQSQSAPVKTFSSISKLESVQQIKSRIDTKEKLTLLDVRTADEYKSGHLADSILLPGDEVAKKAETVLKDKNADIIVYCRTGARSKKAVEILLSMGYTNLTDMQGGIVSWQKAGFLVVK